MRQGQGVEIQKNDILIIRTGWIAKFYKVSREEFYGDFVEPGLTYSPELVKWFHDMEIPNLVTDTIANEVTVDPVPASRCRCTTRSMRNLGVTFTEISWLDDLADDCAADGQWTFLYAAAPLKVVDGHRRTGQPGRHQVRSTSWTTPTNAWLARYLPGMPDRHRGRVRPALDMFHAAVERAGDGRSSTTSPARSACAEVDRAERRAGGRLVAAASGGRPVAVDLQNVPQFVIPCSPRGRRAASSCRSTR